ncbi:LysM peptidoglycan-binding domain-containing protein [Mameliella sp. CS4]|uniref:LysM peptidoglycan-binding domain-containing protein n=1 Tax=Mameliella sp. CS4 TaxID=2862329 RepID=UPI001C5DE5C0|nr:LysM peptidoglycan-binding domain-containing protein [Mameliella sp. CS4]MBW4981293.1 LysM peptidoglycan-binding domain-containing protein [Mameliella sp. CS4]
MIRIILFSTAFVAVTAALIVFQPGAAHIRDRMAGEPDMVTRAATTPDPLPRALARSVEAPQATGPDPAGDVTAVLSALVREAQKPTAPAPQPQSANPALAIAAAVKASQGAAAGDPVVATALLSQLGKAPAAGAEGDALMAMTQDVLANLTGGARGAGAPQSGDLQTLVVQALRQGQSDAYLDALLNEARDSGRIAVPESLITSDGKVDTTTLLATLVQRSVGATKVPADSGLAGAAPDVKRPRARPLARAEVYTVQPGDSLAAISYRFYGDTMQYTVIYDANRDKITTPDKIRAGQQLTIPVL